MSINAVILAGGEGKRLWPLSNELRPKQFIKLPLFDKSSFQLSILRALTLTGKIIVITSIRYETLVIDQIDQLGLCQDNFDIILEENINNTGMAVYYSCLLLSDLGSDDLTYFFPSDHIIETENNFFVDLSNKLDSNTINILGNKTDTICLNFGYILADKKLDINYYKVTKFIEKPDTNQNFGFDGNNIYKNLGIYIAKPSVLLDEFNTYYANLPSKISRVAGNQYLIKHSCKGDSLDKMIAEKSFNLNLYKIDFFWKDIGSYENLHGVCKENILRGCDIDFASVESFNKNSENFYLDYVEEGIKLVRK